MHIHPHWYKTVYVNGEWQIDNNYYRLHTFDNINEIIYENKEYLCRLLTEEDSNYDCIAFRAGGFCIQPEKVILKILKKNGFAIDSSVCSGRRCKDAPHNYDFRKIKRRFAWKFDVDEGLSNLECFSDNTFIEIPIVTSGIGLKKIKLFLERMSPIIPNKKGKYINEIEIKNKNLVLDGIHLINRFLFDPYMCEFDSADYKRMLNIIRPHLKNSEKQDKIMAIIGHPKMSWSGWFYHMERFLDVITTQFSDSIKTITMQEAYNIMKNEK